MKRETKPLHFLLKTASQKYSRAYSIDSSEKQRYSCHTVDLSLRAVGSGGAGIGSEEEATLWLTLCATCITCSTKLPFGDLIGLIFFLRARCPQTELFCIYANSVTC